MLPQSPSTARRNQIVPYIKDHHENFYKITIEKFPKQTGKTGGRTNIKTAYITFIFGTYSELSTQ